MFVEVTITLVVTDWTFVCAKACGAKTSEVSIIANDNKTISVYRRNRNKGVFSCLAPFCLDEPSERLKRKLFRASEIIEIKLLILEPARKMSFEK